MKKLLLTAIIFATLSGFSQENASTALKPISDSALENAVIYEANIRQYSKEGTFNAFAKDIPEIKKLGVKILWIMPVYPIGVENRKEGLGSYYSVKDYRAINPEFGNIDDFRKLVKTAHDNGLYVILDWIPNHSAWDNAMVKSHPEYYAKDANGKMIAPFDWTDVVKFDYSNAEMRKMMIDYMSYWLINENIDGFRCDVAMEVPKDFWEECTVALDKIKPNFMLMEAEQTNLMETAFDMQYNWEFHHLMNDIAKGKKTASDWDAAREKRQIRYQMDDIDMNFTSNHDENSWNGTEYERMGDAVSTFAALSFMTKGMPLIYNGQEYDFNHRLKFFVKDEIKPKSKGKMFGIYEKLGKLKNTNPALNGGKNPASYDRIATAPFDKVLAFEREKAGSKVIFWGNLTNENLLTVSDIVGTFTDLMTGEKITFNKYQFFNLKPWEYKILVK
jgi:alpha-amylase